MTPGRWRTADTGRGGFRTTSYTTGLTVVPDAAAEGNTMDATGVFRRFARLSLPLLRFAFIIKAHLSTLNAARPDSLCELLPIRWPALSSSGAQPDVPCC